MPCVYLCSYRSFGVACCESDEDNRALAEKWKRVIKHLVAGKQIVKDQG